MTPCKSCGRQTGMAFECIECCVTWLCRMTKAELVLNAPTIEVVMGAEYMEKVRQEFRKKLRMATDFRDGRR